ncbi:hypothetical protein GQ457_14G022030 [Hibiscus cannabinus]
MLIYIFVLLLLSSIQLGMTFTELPLRMHLGGNLVGNPLKYEGGTVIDWGIDPDVVSHGDLCKLVEEVGYRDVKAFVPEISEAPLSLPAAIIETDEGYNRNNTVDDGKDVSENHVVDEGLSNINNGVGPSEVNSEERAEANINEVGEGLSPTVERGQEEQRGRGVEEEQVDEDEDEDDPLEDVLWLSDNDDEELQEIRNHYRSFRVNEEHSRGAEEQIPPTAKDLEDLLQKTKRRSDSTKNQEKGEGSRSGSETDYLDSSDLGSYGSDDDGEVVCKKSKKDYFDPSDKVPSFQLGMIFENSKQFKAALTKYAIAKRFDFKLSKNDRDKTRAVCKGQDCPWTIYASIDSRDEHYKVKTFIDQHTCSITFKNSRASYKVVAEHFLPKLRIIPDLKLHEMIKLGKEELKLDLTMGVCRRARELAKEEINGNYKYEFKRLFDYANALRRADTDGTIDLLVVRPTPNHRPRFRRFYVCFSAMKRGFRECCRPFVSLDGCFLKGMLEGALLVAVGRDANNQMYPIAWALVESETKYSWGWFVENLRTDLHMMNGERFTIMSDMQKASGLIDAVSTVIPECEHRFCARHWFANWKKLHKNLELHKLFWSCSKATSEADFRKQAAAVGEVKGRALLDMLKKDPTHWSKAFFSTRSLCDSVDNNIAEAFNARLIGARHMSIISMFEEIRHYVMERTVKNKNSCMKWKNQICPKICAKVEEHRELSAFCHVSWNGADGYEVVSNRDTFVVDLKEKKCTCRYWDLTGIPCKHAICVILFKKDRVEEYINDFYKKDMYEKCYNFVIPPLAGEKFWPATNMGDIEPPLPRKLPGRPKKKRVPEEGECSGTSLSRKGRKMRCQLCFKSNEGNTSESIPQDPVHSAVEDNVFDVPLSCSTVPTPPVPPVPTEEPPTPHCSPEPIIPPAPTEEPPTPHCSTEPCIPHAPTSAATHHVSTVHVPSNKKGKKKVLGQFSKPTTRGRKNMEGMGVYVNFNTGLEILNPGLKGQKILSHPTTRSQNAASSKQETTSTTAPKKKAPCKKSGEPSRKSRETNKERKNATRTTSKSSALYCDELRSFLLDLGRKRSIDIVDDVPNTQESNTGTKKQKKGKQNMTNSNKRN